MKEVGREVCHKKSCHGNYFLVIIAHEAYS